jgi:hypothetical protein
MKKTDLPKFISKNYEIHEWRHACAILRQDFYEEYKDICDVLQRFRLYKSHIKVGGGRKSQVAEWIDSELTKKGWIEKNFQTHSVDCFKNRIALEIEWNNKDPFFDRDLNNFRLLFELRAISAGVIITRCDELQEIFDSLGRGASYGASTTHMSKLLPRIQGGGGAGCPLLVFGIRRTLYVEDI